MRDLALGILRGLKDQAPDVYERMIVLHYMIGLLSYWSAVYMHGLREV